MEKVHQKGETIAYENIDLPIELAGLFEKGNNLENALECLRIAENYINLNKTLFTKKNRGGEYFYYAKDIKLHDKNTQVVCDKIASLEQRIIQEKRTSLIAACQGLLTAAPGSDDSSCSFTLHLTIYKLTFYYNICAKINYYSTKLAVTLY